MKVLLTTALLMAVCTAPVSAAEIYKTVDKDGNVVFTDVPTGDRSETVELQETSAYTPVVERAPSNSSSKRRRSLDDDEPLDAEEEEITYSSLSITAPGNDEHFQDNSGSVRISVASEPALGPGHQYEVLLDGKRAKRGNKIPLILSNVDRGTHTVEVRILGEAGEVLMESDTSIFHLGRISAIASKYARQETGGANSAGTPIQRAPTAPAAPRPPHNPPANRNN